MPGTLRQTGRFAQLAVRTSPGLSFVTVGAFVVAGLAPLAMVGAIGVVVDQVLLIVRGEASADASHVALGWAIAVAGCFVLHQAATAVQGAAATALGERIDARLQRDLMRAAMRPHHISHLEDPAAVDLISVSRQSFHSTWLRRVA
jgi:ATP-binding cassette subfamily B protein